MPVVDQIAGDYQGRVEFIGIAGRSDLAATAARAEMLFSDNIRWGLDESLWDLYGARYQPLTFAITAGGRITDSWYGLREPEAIRETLEVMLAAP